MEASMRAESRGPQQASGIEQGNQTPHSPGSPHLVTKGTSCSDIRKKSPEMLQDCSQTQVAAECVTPSRQNFVFKRSWQEPWATRL